MIHHNETEADTRANRIDPALRDAGWGVAQASQVKREVIAPGRITLGGFEDGARLRVDPDAIAQKGRVPKNASIFFTIFQTLGGVEAVTRSYVGFQKHLYS